MIEKLPGGAANVLNNSADHPQLQPGRSESDCKILVRRKFLHRKRVSVKVKQEAKGEESVR
jgi:hypothetical protein